MQGSGNDHEKAGKKVKVKKKVKGVAFYREEGRPSGCQSFF